MNSYVSRIYVNSGVPRFQKCTNSCDFFIYEFICFMNSFMNLGVARFQKWAASDSEVRVAAARTVAV